MEVLISKIPSNRICYPSKSILFYFSNVSFSSRSSSLEITQSFITLGISINSDQETVRQAFLNLVKKYHPDSKSPDANAVKFQEVENAYRILQEKFAHDRFNINEGLGEYGLYYEQKNEDNEVEHPDIKHIAPQHRQYLSYEGVGSGTPTQRYKQYTQFKAEKAVENVTEYRINKLRYEDPHSKQVMKRESRKKVKDIRTGFGMDRLVEDLIQESISRGEFDNLTGKGKPLKHQSTTHNPYVDFVTHKMNQVLIDNGFTPTWITLQKEIREESEELRRRLHKLRAELGPFPLTERDQRHWDEITTLMSDEVKLINAKIDSYNLLVPLLEQQMFHLSLKKECGSALQNAAHKETNREIESTHNRAPDKFQKGSFRELISYFFR